MKKAKIDGTSESIESRHFKKHFGVAWRPPREAPLRTPEDEEDRVRICSKWKYLPTNYFTDQVDAIMDNKKFDIPTSKKGRRYLNMKKVRGHLRTRAEGIKKHFTKPKSNKTRVNPGSSVNVCAAIMNNKVKVWHYLPSRWCGAAAVDLYSGLVIKALRKNRGINASYRLVEDNDPTGHKCKKAVVAKRALSIGPMVYPCYSPDLNPLDYWLWTEVERRMSQHPSRVNESADAYKKRLRRTAMAIPSNLVRAAVAAMKSKAAEVLQTCA